MTPLLDEYARIHRESVEAWGEKTVVFMMVGSFYEVYEIQSDDGSGITWGAAREVSETCHIILTRKNKQMPFSPANPYMCGFPMYCRDRYIERLTGAGYTVVVYDQEENNPTHRRRRMVCGPLVSASLTLTEEEEDMPGSTIENPREDRVGLAILASPTPDHGHALSIVAVNLTTGVVALMEECLADDKTVHALLDRVFLRYTPVELCWWSDTSLPHHTGKIDGGIKQLLRGSHTGILKWHDRRSDRRWTEIGFQDQMFCRAFGGGHESLELERHPLTSMNLAGMLDFIHEHHPLLLQRLNRPVWGESLHEVDYLPHTLTEMHLLTGRPSLFEVMDQTCTRMGHRRYRASWFQPTAETGILNEVYDRLDDSLACLETVRQARAVLAGFHDWESTLRKMRMGVFSARRLLCLWRDLQGWVDLVRQYPRDLSNAAEDAAPILVDLDSRFDRDRLESLDWTFPMTQGLVSSDTDPPLPPVLPPDDPLLENLMAQVGVPSDRIVIQEGRDDIFATIRRMPRGIPALVGGFTARSMAGGTRIYHPEWTQRLSIRRIEQSERERRHREAFHQEATAWFVEATPRLDRTIDRIVECDICWSKAMVAHRYGLTRPIWNGGAFRAIHLRNPLVEHMHPTARFISNDFHLPTGKSGMLLYGQNSAGKSTFLKSIGMNAWLAQTGHFVFADRFEGTPFSRILTKLTIQDNLFRGISTFQNEMMDLRHILGRIALSDAPALILSDELTAGTETWSATAIIAATLVDLLERPHALFVFTTHLHTLQLYKNLYTHPCLQISHIAFSPKGCDGDDPFHRKILDGEGSVMYGIEIAERLGFPPEFIARCFHYRQLMKDRVEVLLRTPSDRSSPDTTKRHLLPRRPSRYNRKVLVDRCARCGATGSSLHTHHRIPQKTAVARHGTAIVPESGGQSIHSAWNLEILCESCHHQEHHHHE